MSQQLNFAKNYTSVMCVHMCISVILDQEMVWTDSCSKPGSGGSVFHITVNILASSCCKTCLFPLMLTVHVLNQAACTGNRASSFKFLISDYITVPFFSPTLTLRKTKWRCTYALTGTVHQKMTERKCLRRCMCVGIQIIMELFHYPERMHISLAPSLPPSRFSSLVG